MASNVVVQFPGNLSSVPTIAALRAIPSFNSVADADVIVEGGLESGDGGGGAYVWKAGSTDADDGLRVIRPNDLTALQAGRWKFIGALSAAPGAKGDKGDPGGVTPGGVGPDELTSDPVKIVAIRDRLGITGQAITLTTATAMPVFEPRSGDVINLNGQTLTIDQMTDTALTGVFAGSGTVVIKSGLARPEWWTVQPMRSAARAVSLGGGGVVALGPKRYPPEFTAVAPMNFANVTIRGAGRPRFAAGFSILEGGTVCEGPFVVDAANVVVEDMGVDSGSAVCTARYGGTAQEGLIAPNIGQVPNASPRPGIRFSRVAVLCKEASAPTHGILVENAFGAIVEDFETVYATNGICFKARRSIARRGLCRGHTVNFAIDKSDSYSPSFDNVWENIDAETITIGDTGPFRIQAATASGGGHTLRGIRAKGTQLAVSLEPAGANNIADVTLDGITSEATRFGGIVAGGAIFRLTIANARITNVLETVPGADAIGHGIELGAGMDTVSITGAQITNTAGEGIRNSGTNVLVVNSIATGQGSGRFGYKGVAGSMKVPSSSNIGTTDGAPPLVITS